jgi:hypothetical protein
MIGTTQAHSAPAKTPRQAVEGLADCAQVSVLLLKLFLAPLLVVASTLAGRRWGSNVAGILVGLPIVAGPILFISYLQHGADFTSNAAKSSLLGLVSLAALAVVFSRATRRFGWLAALALSWTTVLMVDAVLSVFHAPVFVAFSFTLAATMIALISMPKIEPERSDRSQQRSSLLWDLLGRGTATGILVLTVTAASGALGPRWTGLLAPFPIAISVVACFAHAQQGAVVTVRTLAGAVIGLFGFATFCLSVAVFIRPVGAIAFVLGTAVTIAVQLLAVRTRRALRNRTIMLRP